MSINDRSLLLFEFLRLKILHMELLGVLKEVVAGIGVAEHGQICGIPIRVFHFVFNLYY